MHRTVDFNVMQAKLESSVFWPLVLIDDYAKDGGEELLPRCTAFYLQIFTNSIGTRLRNVVHLGKKFLAAIFNAIVYYKCIFNEMNI